MRRLATASVSHCAFRLGPYLAHQDSRIPCPAETQVDPGTTQESRDARFRHPAGYTQIRPSPGAHPDSRDSRLRTYQQPFLRLSRQAHYPQEVLLRPARQVLQETHRPSRQVLVQEVLQVLLRLSRWAHQALQGTRPSRQAHQEVLLRPCRRAQVGLQETLRLSRQEALLRPFRQAHQVLQGTHLGDL